MTLAEALREAQAAGVPRLDAQLLLLAALDRAGTDRAWLIAHDDARADPGQMARYRALCTRRAGGEPLAYLTGEREFFGRPFRVDRRVLVPRPETELLVEWMLEAIADRPHPRVIDLGTGSGAIAISVALARPDAEVHAVDASTEALEVATANARALKARIAFAQGDWLAGVAGPFDVIGSNPPYVAAGDAHLQALHHEPLQALVAGADGLDDLRRIVADAWPCLHPAGWLIVEHGHDQGAAVRRLFEERGFVRVTTRRDLAGIERCTGGQRLELE